MPNKLKKHRHMMFFDPSESAEKLSCQAMSLYSTEGFKLLRKGGNFRTGLVALISCLLGKMTEEEFQHCKEQFNTPTVDDNLLYFAEIANQLAQDCRWKESFSNEALFDWHYRAALYYSTFFTSEVLCSSEYNSNDNLKNIFDLVVKRNAESMVGIDRVRSEAKLLELTSGLLFDSLDAALRLTPIAAATSSSALAATNRSDGQRPGLSFFSEATSYRHNPYSSTGTSWVDCTDYSPS